MGPLSYPYSSILMTSCMHGQLPKTLSPNTIISRAVVSKYTFWGHSCIWVPHSSFCTLKCHGFTHPSLMLQPFKYSKTVSVSPVWTWLIHLYRFSTCSLSPDRSFANVLSKDKLPNRPYAATVAHPSRRCLAS